MTSSNTKKSTSSELKPWDSVRHTVSVFIFFGGALDGFTSSPFFLFPFAVFAVEEVPLADPEGAGFEGLLAAASSLTASFCFEGATGVPPLSSSA